MTPADKLEAGCKKFGLMFHNASSRTNTEKHCYLCYKKECRKLQQRKSSKSLFDHNTFGWFATLIADSGISHHLVNVQSILLNFKAYKELITLASESKVACQWVMELFHYLYSLDRVLTLYMLMFSMYQ